MTARRKIVKTPRLEGRLYLAKADSVRDAAEPKSVYQAIEDLVGIADDGPEDLARRHKKRFHDKLARRAPLMRGMLVDAGPVVAIFSRRDRDHAACVEVLKNIRQPLLTPWMPLTEAMYLLDFSIAAQGGLLETIERGALKVLEISTLDLPGLLRRVILTAMKDA